VYEVQGINDLLMLVTFITVVCSCHVDCVFGHFIVIIWEEILLDFCIPVYGVGPSLLWLVFSLFTCVVLSEFLELYMCSDLDVNYNGDI